MVTGRISVAATRLSGISSRQKNYRLFDSVDAGIVQIYPTVNPWDARESGVSSECRYS